MKISKQQLAIYMNKYAHAFRDMWDAGSAPYAHEQDEIRKEATNRMVKLRKELWELINK